MDQGLLAYLEGDDYHFVREIPGWGVCGLQKMLFTVGLFHDLTREGRGGRFCYRSVLEAREALEGWDGVGDPPGEWIKYKGNRGDGERDGPAVMD